MVINPDPKTVWKATGKVLLTHLKDFSVLKELNCLKFQDIEFIGLLETSQMSPPKSVL